MIARWTRQITVVATLGILGGSTAQASSWNERTILTFSDQVMIPGTTLEPGRYIFKILDSNSSRHVVQVLRADNGNEQLALVQAVPLKRADAKGDIVLRFQPTEAGQPPAIQAWFYPGSTFGHQFVYPDEQARLIAERTKTVVLATDQPGTNLDAGTLHVFDASGRRGDWKADGPTMTEWDHWQRTRPAAAAPAIEVDSRGMRVDIDHLEETPTRYIDKAVTVDGQVERVLGPRLFTIDEPNWGDLDGEVLVHMPSPYVALVREDDRVTIEGKVELAATLDVDRELGWIGSDAEIDEEFFVKPMIRASRIVGGDSNVAVLIEAGKPVPIVAGARGGTDGVLKELDDLAAGRNELVGRRVTLEDVRVDEMAAHGGFYITGIQSVFVLPADGVGADVNSGQKISLEGVVLDAPPHLAPEGDLPGDTNDDIYVLATRVTQ